MKLSPGDMLRRLGEGESIASLCSVAGLSRAEFDGWWTRCASERVPATRGERTAGVSRPVEIRRDDWGIPHILAANDEDLFFGFGYAQAQDRLFQLDWLRRKASGRLSEIVGRSALEQDILTRTVGIRRIAESEWEQLAPEIRRLVESFAAGVNAWIDEAGDCLPIEFDLLAFRPESWTPIDCLAIEGEFRWYLTGRFPVIVMPELAKRVLGDGPLYREYLQAELDDECILPPGSYASAVDTAWSPGQRMEPLANAVGGPDDGTGSNNWVIAGRHSRSAKPMVASDPHIAIEAVSCWYEVHLCGGSFQVAGASYVGMPAVLIGRNERMSWSITNNICSQRDLYQERTDPAHPDCYLFDGRWEKARKLTETIQVKGCEPVTRTIRFSRNGPLVDEILPPPGNRTGEVSLNWLGAHHGGWLTALLGMNRAKDAAEFVEKMRPWHVPTFNILYADVDGKIGYKTAGRLPIRRHVHRGYRRGWDPDDQWLGLIPFEAMPESRDPQRGWLASANNRIAGDDYPYPLGGTWIDAFRARRIRQMIEEAVSQMPATRETFCGMQHDVLSLRSVACVPPLLRALSACTGQRELDAMKVVKQWDCRSEADSAGAAIFHVFFMLWVRTVAAERFDAATQPLMVNGVEQLAAKLISSDPHLWFANGDCEQKIVATFRQTLALLAERLGPEIREWRWGRLHRLRLRHVLSTRGDLGQLLDGGEISVKGDSRTVCNTGMNADWTSSLGAGYRMVCDLGAAPRGMWCVDAPSQSGHPGSPHYSDQLVGWATGEYRFMPLDAAVAAALDRCLELKPRVLAAV